MVLFPCLIVVGNLDLKYTLTFRSPDTLIFSYLCSRTVESFVYKYLCLYFSDLSLVKIKFKQDLGIGDTWYSDRNSPSVTYITVFTSRINNITYYNHLTVIGKHTHIFCLLRDQRSKSKYLPTDTSMWYRWIHRNYDTVLV